MAVATQMILKAARRMNRFADTTTQTNPSSGPDLSSHRIVAGTAAVLALLAVSACGSATAGKNGSQPSTTDTPRAAIAVTYEAHAKASDGPYSSHAVLIAAGPERVRLEIESTGMAPMLFVYDGQRLLVHDAEGSRPWSLFEAPEEHPDQFQAVSHVYADPDSAEFAEGCRSATVVGHKPVLGRRAVGYHCATQHSADGSVSFAHVDWLDQSTGLLLQSGAIHATSIDEHPHITASTFSTEPPRGARVAVYAAKKRPAPR
jgi:outer membrane lipoprotein-sorting protein